MRPAANRATQITRLRGSVKLESGTTLRGVDVAWRSWGALDADGSNAVLVCHALTGDANVDAWWPGLLGPDHALDPTRDFVVATNVLGGCAGTTGPDARHPRRAKRFGADFPTVTIRDMVQVQRRLLAELGVRRLRLVIGGSMGGMQALEWAATYGDMVEHAAVIAATARHEPWAVAWSEAQRQALFADPRWRDGDYPDDDRPVAGLAAARMIGMTSYRSHGEFRERFARGRPDARRGGVRGWLAHHGQAINTRFDATSYVRLLDAMDSHDVARGRGPLDDVLASIDVPVLVVAIDSDVLYPPVESQLLAHGLPRATLRVLDAPFGHDSFLIRTDALDAWVHEFSRPVRSTT